MNPRQLVACTLVLGFAAAWTAACSDPAACQNSSDCFEGQVCRGGECVNSVVLDGSNSPPDTTRADADPPPDTAPDDTRGEDTATPDTRRPDTRTNDSDDGSAPRFVDVAAGQQHGCGLLADGRVYCWGGPPAVQSKLPYGERFTSIRAGGHFTCGRSVGGSIRCWGPDLAAPHTQTHTSISRGAPYDVGAFGPNDSEILVCAHTGQGVVDCFTQKKNDRFTITSAFGLRDVVASRKFACATVQNKAKCKTPKSGAFFPPDPPDDDFTNSTDLTCTIDHNGNPYCCALDTNGRAVCFSDSGRIDIHGPEPTTSFDRIVGGDFYLCARRSSDRSVQCWAERSDNRVASSNPMENQPVDALAGGPQHVCALQSGRIRCWGYDQNGRLNALPPKQAAAELDER
ncbi:MAG: hypothetical protein ABEL76_16325 [Bradymonadaceae bacterium]